MKKINVIAILSFVMIIGSVVGVSYYNYSQSSEASEASHGLGLKVPGEKDLISLKENSDLILNASIDEIYDTEMVLEDKRVVEDKEFITYHVKRIYTVTINNSFKDSAGIKYKKGDKIKVTYPIGFQQFKDGEPNSDLVLLDDELVSLESGEYILFLDEINGEYHFTNGNHIYKKGNKNEYKNIATDSIPIITEENLSAN
jgi:hypothetical protein